MNHWSLPCARVRRIPAFLMLFLTTFAIILWLFRSVNRFSVFAAYFFLFRIRTPNSFIFHASGPWTALASFRPCRGFFP